MRISIIVAASIAVYAAMAIYHNARAETLYTGQARVHDGDTIKIGEQSFRLHGIDAPELSERYGIESRNMMRDIIREQPVLCTPTGGKSYKRLVAVCTTAYYSDIAAELVRRGYALDCARYSHGQYRTLEPQDARTKIKQKEYCK